MRPIVLTQGWSSHSGNADIKHRDGKSARWDSTNWVLWMIYIGFSGLYWPGLRWEIYVITYYFNQVFLSGNLHSIESFMYWRLDHWVFTSEALSLLKYLVHLLNATPRPRHSISVCTRYSKYTVEPVYSASISCWSPVSGLISLTRLI